MSFGPEIHVPVKGNFTEKAVLKPIDSDTFKGKRPSRERMLATAAYIRAQDTLDILASVVDGDADRCQELMEGPDSVYWGINFRDTFLGWVGYRYRTDSDGQRDEYPGGVTILFDGGFQGMGIGSASSLARVNYAFEVEKVKRMRMVIDFKNKVSIVLARKLGGICLGNTAYIDEDGNKHDRHQMVVFNPASLADDFRTLEIECAEFPAQDRDLSLKQTQAKIDECRDWKLL
jgi:RimJ/RimL family protein N-acetyltransferase